MRRLLDNVRERKLDRIAIGYTVAVWAIVQGVSMGASAFGWRPWILQVSIVTALLGFPLALIGGWVVALRGASDSGAPPGRTDFHVLAVLGGLLAIAGALLFVVFWPGFTGTQRSPAAPLRSLAVLPFANLSGAESQRYISDGIADQLIAELSEIPALQVAARTSSFSTQVKGKDVKAIARLLNVGSILEGSVLGDPKRLRIAAELVDATTGFQVWSATYNRDVNDILSVQDSIAHAITAALSTRLLGRPAAKPASKAPALSGEDYKNFLLGRFYLARDTEADSRRAAEFFKQVTLHAPGYAEGFAQYANALISLASDYGDAASLRPADIAARHALELDSRNLLALRTMSLVSRAKWDWLAAADYFRRAREINPNSSGVLHSQSVLAATFNFPQQDFDAERKAADLDPLSFVDHYNLAIWYLQQRRFDEAFHAQQAALSLQPANVAGRDSLCSIEVQRKNLAHARVLAAAMTQVYSSDPEWRLGCPLDLALAEGRKNDAREFADQTAAAYTPDGGSATPIGNAYRSLGDIDRALVWYERAYAARELDLLQVPFDRLQTDALLKNARWRSLWARQPIKDWQSARAEVAKILGVGR